MGGKVWSTEEERVFWEVVVPVSPNAANPAKRLLSWVECVDLMKREIGANARREYTHTMLYEHHYQNFKPGAKSPKANAFLEKHLRDIEWFKENKTSPPPAPAPAQAQAPTSNDTFDSLMKKLRDPRAFTKHGFKPAPLTPEEHALQEEIENFLRDAANPAAKPTIRTNSSSFTPINQRGQTPLELPKVGPATAPARNTVANSFANPAARTATSTGVLSFAKLAAAPAANSSVNPAANNPGFMPKPLPRIQRQVKTTRPTQTVRQPTTSQAPVTQPSAGPNALLGRQSQSFGNGIQDVRRTQSFTGAGTTNQARGSSSYAQFYQGYTATSQQTPARPSYQAFTQAPRQSPVQTPSQIAAAVKEEGPIRLPSIREMFPFTFVGPEQEAFARREADAMLQNRKRSTSAEDEQSPAPKRRPLPDHPTPRQN
ncbi:hypothetical protein CDV36_000464 [Fusarium kuroshium]|uniref:Uncharacterized protein n=1 Tax=Fusarium kuroshium TaxID=2010991 RepID=A0A3M2SRE4_9HYPO|nr:hypothetical protein CDV36_000464 [Fusarium kuroshium]